MRGPQLPHKNAFKAKWHGKNKSTLEMGNSQPLLRPAERLLIRLRSCGQLIDQAPGLEDDICTALLHQAAVYASFMSDVSNLRVNVLDTKIVNTIRSVDNFCSMIEEEYSSPVSA